MTALQKLQPDVTIVKPISDYMDPIMEVCYEPSPPDFTIRFIISAIVSAEPASFSASIYHPPTLEQRARSMQLHEQRALLLRLLFTFIIAIPTFIIGVVYMSLVPSSNQTKQYLMMPMWDGNASRSEWALFFLATPIYFYGAGLFHRRSIKEIKALWRKGSTTPIIKRFTRFGSMNLLVCTASIYALSYELIPCVTRYLAEYPSPSFLPSRFSLLQRHDHLRAVVQRKIRHISTMSCS